MRLVRSWPSRIPPGRSYVEDGVERLVIENHDYKALATLNDDVLLLEWDVAVGQEDLRHFARHAADDLSRVLVGPYRIYADAYGLPQDVWSLRHWDGTGSGNVTPTGATAVQTGDPVCQLFGLGMAYLPQRIVAEFAAIARHSHFGDVELSMWHYQHVTHDVPICWDVHPVHLHYHSYDLEGAPGHA